MSEFNILDHLEKLESDGGHNDPRGDHSYLCPACGSSNFKVNHKSGKWSAYGCECSSTEAGKRKIRDAISPAIKANDSKPVRVKQSRAWKYFTSVTLERNEPALVVHRTDDGQGKRRIWQESLIKGHGPAEVKDKVLPYGLPEALKPLEDGRPYIFWVEGEPCVDALRALGLFAITSIGGAGKFNPDRDAGHIPAERLVVVPDRDKHGIEHAEQVAAAHEGCQWLFPFPNTPQWNGSLPDSHGLDIADWIQLGATAEQIINGIGPKVDPHHEEMPDIRDQFLRDADSLKARLDRGLGQIDAIPDVASRSVALHTLQADLGLSDRKFQALLKVLSEAKTPKVSESFDDLMAEDDDELKALVDDLLPSGLVLIAAEGFAGKTSTGYQLAESVTLGGKFAGQFQCEQSPVLIVQMDESKADAKRKWRRMDLSPTKGQFTIKWKFTPMMFPELRRWIQETGSRLVILDSLMTIAGGEISPKDAEFGLMIYRLNELAGELGITIVCLHHVVKGNTKRTEIAKEDIFGTAYVYNGASDVWGLWRGREDGTGDDLFSLRCLKARSGLVDVGTTYQFTGNDEDRRLTFKGFADRSITLNEIKNARVRITAYLNSANGAGFTPKQLCDILQLGSVKYAAKLCGELYDRRAVMGIERKKIPSSGGRPSYAYFLATKSQYVEVEKVKVPPTSPPISTPFLPAQEPSEREESGGVRGDFSPDYLSGQSNLPDWADDIQPEF